MAKSSIKTAFIGGPVDALYSLTANVPLETVLATWVPQDNIRIVAIEVGIIADLSDANSNADGALYAHAQISRSGRADQAGCLLAASVQSTWNGVVAIGGPAGQDKTVNFPTGTGVDIDSGESLNLILQGSFVAGSGSVATHSYAILHYVER